MTWPTVRFWKQKVAYKEALQKVDYFQKMADEFCTLLKSSELEKGKYIKDCRESRMRINELESKIEDMVDQLSETVKIGEQLPNATSELNAYQGKLLNMESELTAARESNLDAGTQVELMETELRMERLGIEELLRHVFELNESFLHSKPVASKAEKENCLVLSGKGDELKLATATVVEAKERLEQMREQLQVVHELENQLATMSVFVDSLKLELQQANELHESSEKAASDVIENLNQVKLDLELQEKKNSEQAAYIKSLEMEMNQLELEFEKANEELRCLSCGVESMTVEMDKGRKESKETETRGEMGMIKSKLSEEWSKIAVAEATEARARSEKSRLCPAVQWPALEAEAKNDDARFRKSGLETRETEVCVLVNHQYHNSSHSVKLPQMVETKAKDEERKDHVMIPGEEYESLTKKVDESDQVREPGAENRHELEILRRELEIKALKICEFRTRAEQAISRAEVAEKAKADLEDRLKRWRERRERRKAALAALEEESIPEERDVFESDYFIKTHQPLSEVLNMSF